MALRILGNGFLKKRRSWKSTNSIQLHPLSYPENTFLRCLHMSWIEPFHKDLTGKDGFLELLKEKNNIYSYKAPAERITRKNKISLKDPKNKRPFLGLRLKRITRGSQIQDFHSRIFQLHSPPTGSKTHRSPGCV